MHEQELDGFPRSRWLLSVAIQATAESPRHVKSKHKRMGMGWRFARLLKKHPDCGLLSKPKAAQNWQATSGISPFSKFRAKMVSGVASEPRAHRYHSVMPTPASRVLSINPCL